MYMYGSKTDEGTEGTLCEELDCNISLPLGDLSTVYQSEILALIEGAERLLDSNYNNKKTMIYSDSESSLKALSSYKISSKLVDQWWSTMGTKTRTS